MLSAIFSAIGGQVIDSMLGKITGLFDSYLKKQISIEELRAGLVKALLEAISEVEKSHAESIAKTYESFMKAVVQSPTMMRAWSAVVYSELVVLVWHQLGIPAFTLITGIRYPSSGTTVEWAYALLAGTLGLGAVALRVGPAALDLTKWKSVIGK